MTLEELDIDKLIDEYAWRVVDDMTLDTLRQVVAGIIARDFDTETDDYIIETIKDSYPELLND